MRLARLFLGWPWFRSSKRPRSRRLPTRLPLRLEILEDRLTPSFSSTTVLSPTPSPATYGQAVTLSVQVSSPDGSPTGNVSFFLDGGATPIDVESIDGGGQATFSVTGLNAGTHSVSASYEGDGSFDPSDSGVVPETVDRASITVVGYTAPYDGSPHTATAIGVNGEDLTSLVDLSGTTHTVANTYSSDPWTYTDTTGNYNDDSGTVQDVISKVDATIVVTGYSVSSYDGTPYTAAVTTLTGVNGEDLTGSVDLSGTTHTNAGSYDDVWNFSYANYNDASGHVADSIGKADASTSVTVVVAPYTNSPYTGSAQTATVTTATGVGGELLTGSIDLSGTSHTNAGSYPGDTWALVNDNYTSLSGNVDDSIATVAATISVAPYDVTYNGSAQVATITTATGVNGVDLSASVDLSGTVHTNAGSYPGDTWSFSNPNYNDDGGVVSDNISAADTTTGLTASLSTAEYGQLVAFTATVGCASTTAVGAVTFLMDGATTLGTKTLDSGGVATLSTSVPLGGHSITASFGSSTNFNGSASSSVDVSVGKATTSTTLSAAPNPSIFGDPVTYTAVVHAPNADPASISFVNTSITLMMDGALLLGPSTPDSTGTATFTTNLPIGVHTLTAVFSGADNFSDSASTPDLLQTVDKANTPTALVANPAGATVYSQAVTFTASVAMNASNVAPTGTVVFKDGNTSIGSVPLDINSVATLSTSSLTVGNHSISASYGGDSNYDSSTSITLVRRVNTRTIAASITSTPNGSVYGQDVTFTATLSVVAPATGVPSGVVTFKDGSAVLGTGLLDGSGQATLTTNKLNVGTRSIRVSKAVSATDRALTSQAYSQTVGKDGTATVVSTNLDPSFPGEKVIFTASVTAASPGSGRPDGAVTFMDGATRLGRGTLNNNGQALLTLTTSSSMALGVHTITGIYGGSSHFTTSTSPADYLQTVQKAASSTTLTSNVNPSLFSTRITLTATVTGVGGQVVPTGKVTFMDGATSLGSASLSRGNAVLNVSTLAVGSHALTAVYGGDNGYLGQTSASAYTQTVVKGSSSTTVTSSANPGTLSKTVTLTATVAVGAGGPAATGTMLFKDGATTIGQVSFNGGVAKFSTSALTLGTHAITAVYSGSGVYDGSGSSSYGQTIMRATTTTIALPASPAVNTAVNFTVSVASTGAIPAGTVTFRDGAADLGVMALNSSGKAVFSFSFATAGHHTLRAAYVGDSTFLSSISGGYVFNVTA